MKTFLKIFVIFSFISVNAQYTLTDDDGNPILDGEMVISNYDLGATVPEAEFDVWVHSTNMKDFRFEIVSTNQGVNADNWVCTNFGVCYPPTTTDVEVALLADSTRELQLHYRPNGELGEATVNYRITEVGNPTNTISYSVKYVGITTGINQELIDESKITAFPNPANQYTQIKYEITSKGNIYLYNNIGEIVDVYSVDNSNEFININTSELKAGIYFYKIVANSNATTKAMKLIVTH